MVNLTTVIGPIGVTRDGDNISLLSNDSGFANNTTQLDDWPTDMQFSDRMIYTTGANLWGSTTLTAYGRSLIGASDEAGVRTLLGLGTSATFDHGTGPNNLVRLDGAGKIPAVDGRNLTGLTGGPPSYETIPDSANLAIDVETNDIVKTQTISSFSPPQFVGVLEQEAVIYSGTPTSINLPSGIQTGDLIIVAIQSTDSSVTITGVTWSNDAPLTLIPELSALDNINPSVGVYYGYLPSGITQIKSDIGFAQNERDDATALIYAYRDTKIVFDSTSLARTIVASASNDANPPNVNVPRDLSTVLSFVFSEDRESTTPSLSGWTINQSYTLTTGVQGGTLTGLRDDLNSGSNQGPGNFTQGANGAKVMSTMVLESSDLSRNLDLTNIPVANTAWIHEIDFNADRTGELTSVETILWDGGGTPKLLDGNSKVRLYSPGSNSNIYGKRVYGTTDYKNTDRVKIIDQVSQEVVVNIDDAEYFIINITQNIGIDFTDDGLSPLSFDPADKIKNIVIELVQDTTARTVTWESTVHWNGGSAPSAPAANESLIVSLCVDPLVNNRELPRFLGNVIQGSA